MAHFFTDNLIGVFFFYGLAFFSMGLAVILEVSHSSDLDFAKSLKYLAGFGLVHGSHEWFEMGLIIRTSLTGEEEPEWVFYLRLLLLAISFLLLVAFGARLIIGPGRQRLMLAVMITVICLWGVGLIMIIPGASPTRAQLVAADVYTRYSLAIPGAALTTWGLLLPRLSKTGHEPVWPGCCYRRFSLCLLRRDRAALCISQHDFSISLYPCRHLSELVRLSNSGISRLDGNHSRSVHHSFSARV
jgi:hypothetical protein